MSASKTASKTPTPTETPETPEAEAPTVQAETETPETEAPAETPSETPEAEAPEALSGEALSEALAECEAEIRAGRDDEKAAVLRIARAVRRAKAAIGSREDWLTWCAETVDIQKAMADRYVLAADYADAFPEALAVTDSATALARFSSWTVEESKRFWTGNPEAETEAEKAPAFTEEDRPSLTEILAKAETLVPTEARKVAKKAEREENRETTRAEEADKDRKKIRRALLRDGADPIMDLRMIHEEALADGEEAAFVALMLATADLCKKGPQTGAVLKALYAEESKAREEALA